MFDNLLVLRQTQLAQLHRLLAVGAVVGGPDVRRGDGYARLDRPAGLIPPEERRFSVPASCISTTSAGSGSFGDANPDLRGRDTLVTTDKPGSAIRRDGEGRRVEIEGHRGAEENGTLERMPRRDSLRVLQHVRRGEGGALREADHAVEGAFVINGLVQQVQGGRDLGFVSVSTSPWRKTNSCCPTSWVRDLGELGLEDLGVGAHAVEAEEFHDLYQLLVCQEVKRSNETRDGKN
ncbi:hypothetical protein T310_2628 [Rasamsonia emersonii CBS 393.64]|uniref:Uncharacterized protein n=1 Tax=Rasamsonia emersonii (strain ATCC 16479 / CBS 393.64 / IMI 116815) TaxID=1408163 RepID=A0A0F4YYQ2_RASE3|nr:hypothetical protein T310_2628 [Rasamsonia emersonii CBS 393.64]KKA23374.1 hypothetical protein T310_2628 [Rasamsonia emersonii CBS 393.64]